MISASTGNTQAKLNAILTKVDNIKPLPVNVTRAIKLMSDPDVDVRDVAAAIALDQALAARILKLANSAYYGFTHPASTLHEAVVRLGFRRTKTVLFTVTYSNTLNRRVSGYNLARGVLWQHSVAVAMVAQRLSQRVAYPAPDEAYIAGLLHDIGKLMIAQYYQLDWEQLLNLGESQKLMLFEVERYLYDIDHAQVGGALAHKWNLPAVLQEAIGFHHDPPAAPTAPQLAAIVHLADIICLRYGIGLTHESFLPIPNYQALALISVPPEEIDLLLTKYNDMLESIDLPE